MGEGTWGAVRVPLGETKVWEDSVPSEGSGPEGRGQGGGEHSHHLLDDGSSLKTHRLCLPRTLGCPSSQCCSVQMGEDRRRTGVPPCGFLWPSLVVGDEWSNSAPAKHSRLGVC